MFEQLRQAVDDAAARTGLQVGLPRCNVDASQLKHLLGRYDANVKRIAQLEAEVALLKHNEDVEVKGALRLRQKYGARDNETYPAFIGRLYDERQAAEAKLQAIRETHRDYYAGHITSGRDLCEAQGALLKEEGK